MLSRASNIMSLQNPQNPLNPQQTLFPQQTLPSAWKETRKMAELKVVHDGLQILEREIEDGRTILKDRLDHKSSLRKQIEELTNENNKLLEQQKETEDKNYILERDGKRLENEKTQIETPSWWKLKQRRKAKKQLVEKNDGIYSIQRQIESNYDSITLSQKRIDRNRIRLDSLRMELSMTDDRINDARNDKVNQTIQQTNQVVQQIDKRSVGEIITDSIADTATILANAAIGIGVTLGIIKLAC